MFVIFNGRYTVEVNGLSAETSWADVYEFFSLIGDIDKLEITRIVADISVAHITFEETYYVKIAFFLSGSKIADQEVTVFSCGTYYVDSSSYLLDIEELKNGSNSHVTESFPFTIALTWKGTDLDTQKGEDGQCRTVVFPKGNPIQSVKALTFFRSRTFTVDVEYADVSDLNVPTKISSYTIGPFQSSKGERAKLKVRMRLNLHGIVIVESTTVNSHNSALHVVVMADVAGSLLVLYRRNI